MFGLNTTMVVYTPNGSDGAYDVVAASGLACRLAVVQTAGEALGGEREPIGNRRRLLWEAAYTMPENAQVLIDGVRWNVVEGTFAAITGPDLVSVVYRRCEVSKAV